jgi:hypothetical protein
MGKDNRIFLGAYNAIAEHKTYPLVLKDWDFCIPPPPPKKSNQTMTTEQYVERLFDLYISIYRECNNPKLNVDNLDELTADAIAKATTNGSAFTELVLKREVQLCDSFINNISSIVSRSELNRIEIWTREDEGRVRILESIQWKHLKKLEIRLKPGTFETSVMRTLVDGVTKMSEKVGLEAFCFMGETWVPPLTLPEGDLLRTFVAAVSIKRLWLRVYMTLEQILSLLRLTDFSRLETLVLWAGGFDSVKVDAILDGLQHATKLKGLELPGANITEEQKRRMEAKGVTLNSSA